MSQWVTSIANDRINPIKIYIFSWDYNVTTFWRCRGSGREKRHTRWSKKILHSDFLPVAALCIILPYQRRNPNIQWQIILRISFHLFTCFFSCLKCDGIFGTQWYFDSYEDIFKFKSVVSPAIFLRGWDCFWKME